jgi:uncharacterized membrane protein
MFNVNALGTSPLGVWKSTKTLAVTAGSFTFTGEAATLTPTLIALTVTYVLTGFAVGYSIDFNLGSVGSSISGGYFSRKRWHDIKEEERRQRDAEQAERAAMLERQRVEADAAATAKLDAARAELARRHQAIIEALAAQAGATTPGTALAQLAHAHRLVGMAPRPGPDDSDEEEAIMRLLLL